MYWLVGTPSILSTSMKRPQLFIISAHVVLEFCVVAHRVEACRRGGHRSDRKHASTIRVVAGRVLPRIAARTVMSSGGIAHSIRMFVYAT
ncbi:hypothetical protein [Burkholderia metallica]|uniref:hypothetical protein n=1 Tax=Burkholderia metallica TaxID=488729 RepID=UPI00157ACC22|nr:hypothetical protein [Burkholderia metallica]